MKYEEMISLNKTRFNDDEFHNGLKNAILKVAKFLIKSVEEITTEKEPSLAIMNKYMILDLLPVYYSDTVFRFHNENLSSSYEFEDYGCIFINLNALLKTEYLSSTRDIILHFDGPTLEIRFISDQNLNKLYEYIKSFWNNTKLKDSSILIDIRELNS